MKSSNIFSSIPETLSEELIETLIHSENIKIERIVSQGHVTPENQWYDQQLNEWVIVLQGEGTIEYKDGTHIILRRGDYLNIPAHKRHRVSKTATNTIWIAIFY